MGFIRLKALLQERAKEKPPLQDAAVLSHIEQVWRKEGKALFSPEVQEHVMKAVQPLRLRRGTLAMSASDAHAMAAVLIIRDQLLKVIQKAVPDAKITEIRMERRR